MTPLIAMPGPVLPEAGLAPGGAPAMPVLAVLTDLLHGARRMPGAGDWRGGVMRALFAAVPVPPAAVAAQALDPVPQSTQFCFVTPLHVVAGISRVHLPPGGRLQLTHQAREAWRAAFNAEFGSAQLCLHETGGGWLLQSPFALAAIDPDPAELAGQPLAREPSRDAQDRALRRLGAEVEMWLADHPLNRDAAGHRQPPVNCFWFWGGARSMALPSYSWQPRKIVLSGAADAWAAGLAAHAGVVATENAARWETPASGSLLLLAPQDAPDTGFWHEVDELWLAPARQALRTGVLDGLRLQIGGTCWQVPVRAPWRWLRRRRPWHLVVSA